jgi:hypothetical protein
MTIHLKCLDGVHRQVCDYCGKKATVESTVDARRQIRKVTLCTKHANEMLNGNVTDDDKDKCEMVSGSSHEMLDY